MKKHSAHWSELDFIESLKANCLTGSHKPIAGIGDDCAVIENEEDTHILVTTDMLVEDVHFNISWHPPEKLGRKCIAVNLSDIAAMGGTPLYAFVSVALPSTLTSVWMKDFQAGMISMLQTFDCSLAGGDTVKSTQLAINVTIVGSVPKEQAIMRSSAEPGQNIYVSGPLGFAAAGLELYKHYRNENFFPDVSLDFFRQQHLDPTPEVALGRWLNKCGCVSAMQDISDGIATDLAHVCTASSVRGVIYAEKLPGLEMLQDVCQKIKARPTELQVSGGEDYRLVFTVKKGRDKRLLEMIQHSGYGPVFRIGETSEGNGLFLKTKNNNLIDIAYKGFEHASS